MDKITEDYIEKNKYVETPNCKNCKYENIFWGHCKA